VGGYTQLCFQFVQYKWCIAIERLAALKQMLNGEEVHQWTLKSLLLGENIEDIQHFLRSTSTQIGLLTLDSVVTVSLKVNAITLTMACPTHVVYLYSTGLRLAISGLQEQVSAGRFDRGSVQSTFGFVGILKSRRRVTAIAANICNQRTEKMRDLLFLALCISEILVDDSRGWLVEAMLLNMVDNRRVEQSN
jgi:hypothetical protein